MGVGHGTELGLDVLLFLGTDGRVEGRFLESHREPEQGPENAGDAVDVEGHGPMHVGDQPSTQRKAKDSASIRTKRGRSNT